LEVILKQILLLSGVLVFILAPCQNKNVSFALEIDASQVLTGKDNNLVQSANKFGLKLFREISSAEGNENIFISPLSVSLGLGMALNGAKDSTFYEIQQTLELQGLSLEDINKSNQAMLANLDSQVIFEIANSIWHRNTFPVLDEFIELNRAFYNAEVKPLDFDEANSSKLINSWVNKKTHGKIRNIIDQPIDVKTVMFLINAIYFKGSWVNQFDKLQTKTDSFVLPDNTEEECELMMQNEFFPYFENEHFQAIDLPYGGGHFSMAIFLPKTRQNDDVNSLTDMFTEENWSNWSSAYERAKVKLSMPKFKFEYDILLNNTLKELGMARAFDSSSADFKKMYDTTLCKENIYIDEVLHKTFIEVDEKGTEAAAVTKIDVKVSAMPNNDQPRQIVMRIDHPFIFAIRERQSNSILFMGKIINPGLPE